MSHLRALRSGVKNTCFWLMLMSIILSFVHAGVVIYTYVSSNEILPAEGSLVFAAIFLLITAFIMLLIHNAVRFIEWRNSGYK